eukprot:scaffold210387_cov26-Tisochrysis_lutea.AAC.2
MIASRQCSCRFAESHNPSGVEPISTTASAVFGGDGSVTVSTTSRSPIVRVGRSAGGYRVQFTGLRAGGSPSIQSHTGAALVTERSTRRAPAASRRTCAGFSVRLLTWSVWASAKPKPTAAVAPAWAAASAAPGRGTARTSPDAENWLSERPEKRALTTSTTCSWKSALGPAPLACRAGKLPDANGALPNA